jgi:hypothetical protein
VGRSAYSADAGSLRQRLTRQDRSGRVVPPLVKLIVLVLLSLGVWGVSWIALSVLRSALL